MGNTERLKANAEKWIGVKKKNNDGVMMELVAYRTCKDVDVRFFDGLEKHHIDLNAFRKGSVTHPHITKQQNAIASRTGLKGLNKNGEEMTIIRYGSSLDIDVQFADGSISEHKSYDSFVAGSIKRPTAYNKARCEGKKVKATNGQMYEIIKYHNCHDIECRFEDGTIVHARDVQGALNGSVVNPNFKKPSKYTGYVLTASNGLRCKVLNVKDNIAYYQFEDGEEGQMSMSSFLQGMIQHRHLGRMGDGEFFGVTMKRKIPAFRTDDSVYYDCILPDGTKDLLTPQEIMARQGITPVF